MNNVYSNSNLTNSSVNVTTNTTTTTTTTTTSNSNAQRVSEVSVDPPRLADTFATTSVERQSSLERRKQQLRQFARDQYLKKTEEK